jgi:hypothetical protein
MSSNQKPFMNKNETSNADCLQQLVRRLRDGIPVKSIKEESGWEKTEYDLPAAILLMMDAADIIERLSHIVRQPVCDSRK